MLTTPESIEPDDGTPASPLTVHDTASRLISDAAALLVAAELAIQRDELDAAFALAQAALARAPAFGTAYLVQGRIYHLRGDLLAAREEYRRALALDPELALAACNLAFVEFDLDDPQAAVASGRRAIRLDAASADAHLIIGRALLTLHRPTEAEPLLRRAVAIDDSRAGAHHALGRAVQQLGRAAEAIPHHERAIALDPGAAAGWHGLGLALRSLGRFDQAIDCFTRALDIAPDFGEAHCDLAICRQATAASLDTGALLAVLHDPALPVAQRVSAGFGLAKQLDELGLYDDAFQNLSATNALFRQEAAARGRHFRIEDFTRRIDTLREVFNRDFLSANRHLGIASELPVFVVGHYRSGTTLTEQVLASHSAVHGAGELQGMLRLLARVGVGTTRGMFPASRLADMAHAHLAHLAALRPGACRVVDKHPDNVFTLGLIALLYPNARVLVCHRNARDNVLSCFFQRFSEGMTFSNDLADCARRHLEVERLIGHWHSVLPLRMMDLHYEDLVEDLETQARRMIDFLGLPWDPACLAFHATERTVNTPSVWAVRQPIYGSAVGRWRNYERHLAPLLDPILGAPVHSVSNARPWTGRRSSNADCHATERRRADQPRHGDSRDGGAPGLASPPIRRLTSPVSTG